MFDFLSLITKRKYWRLHSLIIKLILRIYGIKVGKNFYIEGIPKLKINGKAENVLIGNNVNILGNVDLRNRENGKIIIKNNVKIENDCRIVSAREGTISIGENSVLGAFSLLNGGSDIIIGNYCAISAHVTINSNEHEHRRDKKIKLQGFFHAPVIIEDDCLIGAKVAINKGVTIKKGSVIGANSVVTKDTKEYSINVGMPAKIIKERS